MSGTHSTGPSAGARGLTAMRGAERGSISADMAGVHPGAGLPADGARHA